MISLGVKLARITGDGHMVRREPKGLSEFRPERLKEAYDAYSSSEEESSEDEKKQDSKSDDGWNEVEEDRQTKRTNARKQAKKEWYENKMKLKAEKEAKEL